MARAPRTATLYELNGALPGVMDTKDNSFQIDMSQLSSYIGQPQQVSVDDLYRVMRPDVNTLFFRFVTSSASMQGGQAVFQVTSIDVIAPDGGMQTYTMSQPVSLVYDQSSSRIYTVGFSQMYDFFNTYITNVQNNYYTTVVYNINVIGTVPVTPAIVYPVLTPIVFPAPFPVYYPVPFPVPFPTVKPSVTPTMKPTVTPASLQLQPARSPG